MAKFNLPPVTECLKSVRNGKLLPVYFLCGEDNFLIDKALAEITKAVEPFLFSDFDKETIWGAEDKNLSDVISIVTAFPFGSEKKLVIVKDFEKFRDKKGLSGYLDSPVDFTVLVLIYNGPVSSGSSEPFKTLVKNGFIFEAKELKGKNLVNWIIEYVSENGKSISPENTRMLMEIVGENRDLMEAQLEKIFTFMADRREISHNDISFLAANMKEYTIFDLLNAMGKKEKASAFKYALNLIDKGKEPVFIIFMLTKYFSTLSRINELRNQNLSPAVISKKLNIFEWTYKDYVAARGLYTENQLKRAAEALLKADVSVKTSSLDEKTIISLLLGEILAN
jgi:DNA polymerase III subunit delta